MLFFKHFLFLCKKISLSLQNMKHLFTVTLIFFGLNLQAQDPANYYLAAEGKTDAALQHSPPFNVGNTAQSIGPLSSNSDQK